MLWTMIRESLIEHDASRINEGERTLSYFELLELSEAFARRLKPGERYGILCASELNTAKAILGCICAGATAVPMAHRYGAIHNRRIISRVKPEHIIFDRCGELTITDTNRCESQSAERPAFIMCSSGTTGRPKAIMLSDSSVETNLRDILAYFPIEPSDTMLICRPIYHCAVLTGELLVSIAKGADIVFLPGPMNPALIESAIETHKITALCGTPTLIGLLGRTVKNLSEIKKLAISGECLSLERAAAIRARFGDTEIFHVYGLTEASPRVLYLPAELYDDYGDCAGIPLNSVQIKLVRKDGSEIHYFDIGECGELCIKGTNVMMGYYDDPIMTDKALKDGWLHTNDIACFNEAGLIKIKGRKDNMIIRAGMNIYPQDIELALAQDCRVTEAVAYGEDDCTEGQRVCLKVMGDFENVGEVISLCRQVLPPYEVPSKVELVESLPRTEFGKIKRN